MKYCSSCKAVSDDECEKCKTCGGELDAISGSEPVTITTIKGKDIALLEAALKSEGIPCSFEQIGGSVYNAYNTKVSSEAENKLLVPFDLYSEAFNVCLGLGIVSEEDRLTHDNLDKSEKDGVKKTYNERFESKAGVKHRTWQMVWIVLFIIVACLIIWGIDFVAEYVKGMMIGNASTIDETAKAVIGINII